MKIKVAIIGYGNLGRGVELAIQETQDMELVGIYTRRNPNTIKPITNVSVYTLDSIYEKEESIDVAIICGGSATDLPKQSVLFAKHFNIVDSFDNHVDILEHVHRVHESSFTSNHVSVVSTGWDPGLFSMQRLLAQSILPQGTTYTFWGKGISQGHSDAIRRIVGVQDAKQYTIPKEDAMKQVKDGKQPIFSIRDKHLRECYVVLKDGANADAIRLEIQSMPAYFADYDTIVHFISQQELDNKHAGIPHGGIVMHSGMSGKSKENKHLYEFSLQLDSNPEFTASVLVAYARAAYRLAKEGQYGCKTVFDIPLSYLHESDRETLIKEIM